MSTESRQHQAETMRPPTDHPWADLFNAARKVVFSRTLKTADWANTTIASGDLAEEERAYSRSSVKSGRLGQRSAAQASHDL
jgi:hypothetical protein